MTRHLLICYSPKDQDGKLELVKQLAPLIKAGSWLPWTVDDIPLGEPVEAAFAQAAARADAAVCLLSSDFLAEPQLAFQIELLRRHSEQRGLRLVPLLWRDCMWSSVDWLRHLQPASDGGVALKSLERSQREHQMTEISRRLESLPTQPVGAEVPKRFLNHAAKSFSMAESHPLALAADPAQLRRIVGYGEPLLDCDRGEQWEKLRGLVCSRHHELIFVTGAEGQAHDFFLDRIELALPASPPRRVIRISWDKPTMPTLPQFPQNQREALTALASALQVSSADELRKRLHAQLQEHHLVILHPTVSRCFDDPALQLYYQQWLPALLADFTAPYRCKIVQPLEWARPSEGWLSAAKGLVSKRSLGRAQRKQAVAFLDALEKQRGATLKMVRLPELSQLTRKDVLKFLEVIHYADGHLDPRSACDELAKQVLEDDVTSDQVLRRLCRALPVDMYSRGIC